MGRFRRAIETGYACLAFSITGSAFAVVTVILHKARVTELELYGIRVVLIALVCSLLAIMVSFFAGVFILLTKQFDHSKTEFLRVAFAELIALATVVSLFLLLSEVRY